MAGRTNRWLIAACVVVPVIALVAVIIWVMADWQVGHGEISFHGMIALAGAGVFSLGLTIVLVALMIRSHTSGQDEETGIPDDDADRERREGGISY